MDILYYAGLQAYHNALNTNINCKTNYISGIPTSLSMSNLVSPGALPSSPYAGGVDTVTTPLFNCWNALCQCLLICKNSNACGLKVCDTSGYYRCGACCLWTVPAGVTFAQFQLWGPGGGAGSACCCGGSFFGPTGAYVVAGIPVTAGATYTICAGCAYCCYASAVASTGLIGGSSFVTGTNINTLCAPSGISCVIFYNASQCSSANSSCCVWWNQATKGYPSPGCICSCTGSWEFCGGTSTTTAADYSFSCITRPSAVVSGTGSYAYGIPGMYPKWSLSGGMVGSTTAAPIFGFTTTSMCQQCFTGTTCGGCSPFAAVSGYMQIPGQGGWASTVFGGCSPTSGDAGRMGMVCITYC